jgi:hypothetical protein
MQNQQWNLTPDSGEIKGNNPYQLNRMTVDPQFRNSGYNVNQIKGYSATGEIMFKPDALTEPKKCWSPMDHKKINGDLLAANQTCGVANFKENSQGPEEYEIVEGFARKKCNNVKRKREQENNNNEPWNTPKSDWAQQFPNHNAGRYQSNLHSAIQARYSDIMSEESELGRY